MEAYKQPDEVRWGGSQFVMVGRGLLIHWKIKLFVFYHNKLLCFNQYFIICIENMHGLGIRQRAVSLLSGVTYW